MRVSCERDEQRWSSTLVDDWFRERVRSATAAARSTRSDRLRAIVTSRAW
jgi:hypothetical protein